LRPKGCRSRCNRVRSRPRAPEYSVSAGAPRIPTSLRSAGGTGFPVIPKAGDYFLARQADVITGRAPRPAAVGRRDSPTATSVQSAKVTSNLETAKGLAISPVLGFVGWAPGSVAAIP